MKSALITGGSRGIGKACVELLSNSGYEVLQPTRNELDLINPSSITNYIEQLGKIDLLVNNAGIAQRKPFMELTVGDWNHMLDTNLRGTFLVTQGVLRNCMLPYNHGSIINIGSMGGVTGGVEQVHYATSKAGIISLTQSINRLYAEHGIRCNCVNPGVIDTDMNASYHLTNLPKCGRIGTVDEVAEVVKLLAESTYIYGESINMNGG